MITFYDINEEKEFKPELEFKTKRKLDPFKILSNDTFIIALKDNQFDLYLDNSTFRFTPEFRFKLEKHSSGQNEYKEILLFSADAVYFELLKEFLKLEPCFKFKPPESLSTEEIKKIISASTCKHGFLEINCFADTIALDILLLNTGKEIEKIKITEINRINRILIYDTEKNLSCGLTTPERSKRTPSEDRLADEEENLRPQTKLFKLIADYFEKNISAKIIWDIPLDRDAIFREHATPETLEKTFTAIKKAIEKIKLNQKEHKEKIKELISIFYSENYNELEKLNLTTTIEKLYAQL